MVPRRDRSVVDCDPSAPFPHKGPTQIEVPEIAKMISLIEYGDQPNCAN